MSLRRTFALACLIALALSTVPLSAAAAQSAGPAPYAELDVTIPVPAGHTLSGTLTLPRTPGPHPAVVLVSGSGPQDRDESLPIVPGYRPFRVIADHLARAGIAVLRYDDRGTGKSTGNHLTATSADFADDAEAAWRFLRGRRDIHPLRVGLLGHSEGGLIAARVAARNRQVAFIVSMAGPAVLGYDVLVVQTERALRASGLGPQEVAEGVATSRAMLDIIRLEQWDRLRAMMFDVGRQQIAALPEEQRAKMPPLEQIVDQQMTYYRGWMRFFLSYDPSKDWARVRVPVLALFGVLDVQVDLWQNRAALLAALERARNPDVTVAVFPRANHLFQQARTGHPQEYAGLPVTFVPEFLQTISRWILDRFGGR